MPTNRRAYFEALSLNIPKDIIYYALEEVNEFNHADLLKSFDEEIKDYQLFKHAIDGYLKGEMIEYIFHKKYFLSNPFYVNEHVLIPRQETEQLVLSSLAIIKEMFGDEKINVADVCTGSGVIGVSIAKALPLNNYYLSDISKEAMRVAKMNATKLTENVNFKFLLGDMLEPLNGLKLDVLICNPPYIDNPDTIDKRTFEQEPHLALLVDKCTKHYETILKEYHNVMKEKFLIAFEIGEDMENELDVLVKNYCPNSHYYFEKDMYGKTRFLFIKQL